MDDALPSPSGQFGKLPPPNQSLCSNGGLGTMGTITSQGLFRNPSADVAAGGHSLEEIKKYSLQMEKEFKKLCIALEGHAQVEEHNHKHTTRVIEALVPIGKARTFMSTCLETRDNKNELIKTIFAPEDDCSLIATLRTTAEAVKSLLTGTHFERDERVQHCIEACDNVEQLLKNVFRLEARLAMAREKAVAKNDSVRTGIEELSPLDRIKLIAEIDEGDQPHDACEKLWRSFAGNEQGETSLSGESFHAVIDLLCEYVSEESRERSERKKIPLLYIKPDSKVLRDLVTEHMDPNSDSHISKEEFIEGAQKVVNDIEPSAEVKNRTSELEKRRSILPRTSIASMDEESESATIERMWQEVDLTSSGALSGDAYRSVCDRFCQLVSDQSRLRSQKFGIASFYLAPDSPKIRDLVKQFLDPNNDGSIDKAEFLDGARRILKGEA